MSNSTSPQDYSPEYLAEYRGWQIVATAVAFIVVDTIALALRSCSRRLQKTNWMWGDTWMILSWIFNLGVCTSDLVAVRLGAGRHVQAVTSEQLTGYIKLIFAGSPAPYLGAITFPKLAILDLYLHIMVDKFSRYTSYTIGAIISLSAIVNFATILGQCHPFDFTWNPTAGGSCNNIHAHYTWMSFPNIITDLIMLLLPVPMILKLHSSWQVKVGILITFLTGSLGLVTSVIRFVEFQKFGWNNGVFDPTYLANAVLIWSAIEPGVYHLAACFLTLRPLFRWIALESPVSTVLTRLGLTSSSGSQRNNSDGGSHSGSSKAARRVFNPFGDKSSLGKTTISRRQSSEIDRSSEDHNTLRSYDLAGPNGGKNTSHVVAENGYPLDNVKQDARIHVKHDFAVSSV